MLPFTRFRATLGGALMALTLATPPVLAETQLPPREPSPPTVRQIHSGHSLTDTYMIHPWPGRLILATERIRGTKPHDTIKASTIPGSPMRWRWDNPTETDARRDIGDFELLVITEGSPLMLNEEWFVEDTLHYLDLWVENTWKNGNGGKGAELMLYSTWPHWRYTNSEKPADGSGEVPFRERLDVQGALWERMQDSANVNRPDGMKPVYMIPGHRLLARIYDDIAAGTAPFASIGDIFEDDIHLNDTGNYAVSSLVYAVIYQRNPAEIPDRLAPEDTLTQEQARYLKTVAWDVATSYPRTGVPAN